MLHVEAKVEELLSAKSGGWNVGLIKQVLNEEELLPKKKRGREASRSADEAWRKLWNLNIPGVTKIFVWKAITNCLPTKKNLLKRKVVKEALCPVCKREDESVCHTLWSCNRAGDVWACERSPVHKWPSSERDVFEFWSEWSSKLAQDQVEIMAMVLRRVWLRRNGWVFENRFKGPNEVFSQAVICLTEFQQAQSKQGSGQLNSAQCNRALHWKPLVGDVVKVNWDAALRINDSSCGIGVVIRDSCGELLVSLCCFRSNVLSPIVRPEHLA
ncbi:hypothetical protein CIPAW_11G093000 [Carya illinoinensis]|uniref:Reverse transcriptase zinc-binding domain-containing protein n=1 Tax=Carya illinoinensis TaxID=32201 RepID=A0A8T1P5N0_CARIL|nr:hypothetical protein CIPAW_11G093000 [Carya illinoinensis]